MILTLHIVGVMLLVGAGAKLLADIVKLVIAIKNETEFWYNGLFYFVTVSVGILMNTIPNYL